MATNKNITMKQYNGLDYDTLYPKTTPEQVGAVSYEAQSLTDGQKTQARGNIGAAPDGFGFGERLSSVSATSASELYADYCAKVDAVLAGMPDKTAKLLNAYPPHVYSKAGTTVSILYKSNDKYAVLSNLGSADKMLSGWRMIKDKNAWDPFEWVNPPVELGVEYRTTERYWGKPVYVKVVDCGIAPNNTEVSVLIQDGNGNPIPVNRFVSINSVCYADSDHQITIPSLDNNITAYLYYSGNAPVIYIKTTTSSLAVNGYHVIATIKYTKTTD